MPIEPAGFEVRLLRAGFEHVDVDSDEMECTFAYTSQWERKGGTDGWDPGRSDPGGTNAGQYRVYTTILGFEYDGDRDPSQSSV